ncbi:MAG: hypothetical protein CK549_04755 [Cyanobium sp. Baikal-G2]|nr:MAG: hypothetical protein CK549_04755 [Cyanobium sp. Baikal-G2]
MPNNVDAQQLKARFHDGLLEVEIPKSSETQTSVVQIQVE